MFYKGIKEGFLQIIDGVKTNGDGKCSFHREKRHVFPFKIRKEELKKLKYKVYILKSVYFQFCLHGDHFFTRVLVLSLP